MTNDCHSGIDADRAHPLISIIIPVFNIDEYLPDCLASITGQAFRDLEIIAVDGGSFDDSGSILAAWQEHEPRLKVTYAHDRIGPGRARNIGVQQAHGDYIWFVDGDDILPDGCLTSIANHIELIQPDVLLMNYEAFYATGRSKPGFGHHLMARSTADFFTIAEHPWVIGLPMASWNKIVRREFFLATDASFASEWPHEDIAVTCLLLLHAGRLSMLNQVCYRYRKGRAGSATTAAPAKRHFNIFRAYESVLDRVVGLTREGNRRITVDVHTALWQRAISHYLAIFDGNAIARRDRRAFFERIHWNFHRYAPSGHPPAGTADVRLSVKYRLIERNSYWGYRLLRLLRRQRLTRRAGVPPVPSYWPPWVAGLIQGECPVWLTTI